MISDVLNRNKVLPLILLIFSEFIYLLLYSGVSRPIILFFTISLINSVLFLILVYLIKKDRLQNSLFLIIFFGVLFRATVIFLPITASDDIYRYLWDGKVQINNINPYSYSADDNNLNFLHSQTLPEKVNHPDLKAIYPPFSQYVFYVSYAVFGENYFGFKFILLFFEIATIIFLILILNVLGKKQEYAGIYSFCPLPIMQFMIDGHLDAIGITLLVIGLYFLARKKFFLSSIILGLSISTKLISGMVLPYLPDKKISKLILIIIIPMTVFALTYIPYISPHVNPFESLATFSKDWSFNGSVSEILFKLTNNNQSARKISAVLFILAGIILFFSKKEQYKKVVLIFFAFLLLTPTVHPWYVAWLAALIVIDFYWSGIAFVILVNLANLTVINYKLNGIWSMPGYVLFIEYLPVYILLIYELNREFRIKGINYFPKPDT